MNRYLDIEVAPKRVPRESKESPSIFVGNLEKTVDEAHLRKEFE